MTLMTAGLRWRQSMMKSCPRGLRAIAAVMASSSRSMLPAARTALRRPAASSSRAGQAHAIAALAEIMGHRRNETKPALRLGDVHIAGRTARLVRDVLQRKGTLQARAHDREWQILVGPVPLDIADRHGLHQSDPHTLAVCPPDHVGQLVFIRPLERHRVDFDINAGALRGFNTLQHFTEIAPTGDFPEEDRIKRIDRDINAAYAAICKGAGILRQLASVSCLAS